MTNTKLPTLLREAERRVNAHVFRRGGDDSLASIPANHERDVDLLLIEAADEIERLRAFIGEIAGWPVAKWMAYEAKKVLSESHEPIAQFPAAGEDHPDLRKVSESAEPFEGRRTLEPRAARDADHCDYPDCEQHWTNVVAQARALLEPLAEHDPAIRQWLKTPDLPTLPGPSRDASMLPDGFPREQRDHDTELEAQERRFKAQLRDEQGAGPKVCVNPGCGRTGEVEMDDGEWECGACIRRRISRLAPRTGGSPE